MGAKNKKASQFLDAIHQAKPATQVSQDSNVVQSLVERDKETGAPLRAITAAEDAVKDEQLDGWNREIEDPEFDASGDYTDEIAEPSSWAGPVALARIAADAGLDADQVEAFTSDPDGFLQELSPNDYDTWGTYQPMSHALDEAWVREREGRLAPARRLEAVKRGIKDHPVADQVKPKGKKAKPRRWEVAPGVFEHGPADHKAIFQSVQAFTDGRAKTTGRLEPHPNFDQAVRYHGRDPREVQDLFDRYNNGERWTA